MQKILVKQPTGATKQLIVHRTYQDISGKQIFLHADGSYGYKDGAPVREASELNILPEAHRQIAMNWWQRIGEKKSRAYYRQIDEMNKRRAGDYQEALAAQDNNTILDSMLYGRKSSLATGKKGAVSAPKSWMEWGFKKRPEWWGQAKEINFPDATYVMQPNAPAPEDADPESPDGKATPPAVEE
ncbi:MAG: hypothetical protein BWY37_02156 [Firmicutes bacterium ADurb.Bin262]|mgnify:CR=1 FL=1|nr:MAG: hypothetical protein BWY37_02156 [Firmicutes bacterium ADurb.Bin262]HPD57817.1 hypothetical protein [Smithellaceae bacterium]